MFYNQPLAHRFGTSLASDIENAKWNRVEIAVAWARRSGTQYLEDSFRKFLGRGGYAQVTVGVDIENTSAEGLSDFLALEAAGNIETYIHHNEADTTFHPKVYLLRNDADARLIVGSNSVVSCSSSRLNNSTASLNFGGLSLLLFSRSSFCKSVNFSLAVVQTVVLRLTRINLPLTRILP